jgi:P-type E1-E2 ATPase
VAGKQIAAGKPQWILEKTNAGKEPKWQTSDNTPKASSIVLISIDNEIVARSLLADQPRSSASDTIAALTKLGLKLELLSGDTKQAVQEIAAQVGIENFRGEATPDEKKSRIMQLKSAHRKVAMMGDGVNDAPALAAADVGISLATGTDLANQASDISLLEGDIKRTLAAFRLSRQVVNNIRQNLMLGLLYNLLALPIAAGLLYPWTGWLLSPMLAAAAMAASSLSVVANALRLRYQK